MSREKYKRVTEVLYPFSGLDKIDTEVVRKAGERGTKVHKICESIASGLGELGVDTETYGYVESFKKWWGDGLNVVLMEHRFWCDELQITGQIDFLIQTHDCLEIVDIKTSYKPSKTWPAQGAAYAYLCKKAGYDVKKIKFLHLSKNGTTPKIYEYPVDDSFFFSILRVFIHFFNND